MSSLLKNCKSRKHFLFWIAFLDLSYLDPPLPASSSYGWTVSNLFSRWRSMRWRNSLRKIRFSTKLASRYFHLRFTSDRSIIVNLSLPPFSCYYLFVFAFLFVFEFLVRFTESWARFFLSVSSAACANHSFRLESTLRWTSRSSCTSFRIYCILFLFALS